ncbi:tyrosyl-tRNA synthetase [Parahypoxylon ruwenzoriense]
MLPRTLSLRARGAPSILCRQCLLRSLARTRQQTRSISQRFLERKANAKRDWDAKAELISEGKAPHLWDIFKDRGYIKDIAGTDKQISELMRLKRIGAYVGIDPTAQSLHVGHLLPLMPLFWMYIFGYQAVSVIGGSTAKIGDPTDRLQTRSPMKRVDLAMNITKIHYQLKRIWTNVDEQAARFGYVKENMVWSRALLNNSQWYNSASFVEVVVRLFRGIRLGPMLSRDTVKRKMTQGDGMSLDEFVYPLMQAWDWWYLFRAKGVLMQIGGSDQYGNIVSGIDAVKYIRDHEPNPHEKIPSDTLHTPVGFTVPLLTDSSGAKFGKSAGNAVWLDQFMTSTFDLYGYFMRRPDADIERLLRLFTFIPLEEISKIVQTHHEDPSKRHAQHMLAYEVVALVHGKKEADSAQVRHKSLFARGGNPDAESEKVDFYPKGEPASANLASAFQIDIELPESLIMGKSISRILHAAGLADSASDGNRLTKHQGAYIGGAPGQPASQNKGMAHGELTFTPIKNWFPQDTKNFLIDGKILILRRGKHFVRVVQMVSDEEWEASGKMYPGEPGSGRVRMLREALRGMRKDRELDAEGAAASADDDTWSTSSEPRARQLLRHSVRPFAQQGPRSAIMKTDVIDSMLEGVGSQRPGRKSRVDWRSSRRGEKY